MLILGIESTCDETGIALVENGRKILRNEISSSLLIHKKYGGVIPEVAAREQIKVIIPLIKDVVSNKVVEKIDAVAISYGPGLIGSLLVGVESAKTLAFCWEKKLIAVNHLIGHFYASWLASRLEPVFPAIGLIVSGGHTDLLLFKSHKELKHLGGTNDDAAGEAFDKIARVLGLAYPGGPEIEKFASRYQGLELSYNFPRPLIKADNFDFSFSGLKTSVANFVEKNKPKTQKDISKLAYYFQEAVVDVLVCKTLKAAKLFGAKSVVVGGGVAANTRLRERMTDISIQNNLRLFFPEKVFSVDNGAMIASAAYYQQNIVDPLLLTANSSLYF